MPAQKALVPALRCRAQKYHHRTVLKPILRKSKSQPPRMRHRQTSPQYCGEFCFCSDLPSQSFSRPSTTQVSARRTAQIRLPHFAIFSRRDCSGSHRGEFRLSMTESIWPATDERNQSIFNRLDLQRWVFDITADSFLALCLTLFLVILEPSIF